MWTKGIAALGEFMWGKPQRDVRGNVEGLPLLQYVYERKRQPDPGTGPYAFETMQLAPHSPIDGAVAVRRPLFRRILANPQVWVGQGITIAPIATQAGMIYGNQMINDDGALAPLGGMNYLDTNAVAQNDPTAQGNAANIIWGNNDPNGG